MAISAAMVGAGYTMVRVVLIFLLKLRISAGYMCIGVYLRTYGTSAMSESYLAVFREHRLTEVQVKNVF